MAERSEARAIRGRSAAPGFAAGRIHRLDAAQPADAPPDTLSTDEAGRLAAALARATADLAALIGRVDAEAAAMLEFQLALIEDDALTGPAFDAIAAGDSAMAAWTARLEAESAGYRAAEDDYFRARAADLDDLGDRVARILAGRAEAGGALPADAVLLAEDLAPSRFLEIPWRPGQAIALRAGSPTAHVAILDRSRGIQMLVGLGPVEAADGTAALVDAETGTLLLEPDAAAVAAFEQRRHAGADAAAAAAARIAEPAVTADGERVMVYLNIGGPDDLAGLDPAICDGIGLVRTEFLFDGRGGERLPGEAEQFAAYARIMEWAAGRPVVIRTLDAGGDKPIPGYTLSGEANPFLGLRGVRLSLTRPEVFRRQIRALLRAAALGDLWIMVPMVSVPREMAAVGAHVAAEAADLQQAGVAVGRPRLGMMVEVPAAALTLDRFAVDFVSIGSNDLTQYVMAAGRDSAAVAELADPTDPAVLAVIAATVAAARRRGIPVSLCGDAGGDPACLPALLGTGLRSVSMAPAAVARAKQAIRGYGAPLAFRGDAGS